MKPLSFAKTKWNTFAIHPTCDVKAKKDYRENHYETVVTNVLSSITLVSTIPISKDYIDKIVIPYTINMELKTCKKVIKFIQTCVNIHILETTDIMGNGVMSVINIPKNDTLVVMLEYDGKINVNVSSGSYSDSKSFILPEKNTGLHVISIISSVMFDYQNVRRCVNITHNMIISMTIVNDQLSINKVCISPHEVIDMTDVVVKMN